MTRFINIPEHEDFFKALKETLNNYAISINKTTYTYFAQKLYIKGQNAKHSFGNLINPNTGKDLKVRELIVLLDNCPEHQKPTLDWLCNRYDFICSNTAQSQSNDEDIKDLLLNISASNGSIFQDFIDFNSDNELDEDEKQLLIKASYKTRALLNQFEEDLKSSK